MFYEDWKFWLFTFTILNTGLTAFGFLVVKYNDFKHLGMKVEKLEKRVEQVGKEVRDCTVNIANLQGRLNTDSDT